MHRSCPGRTPTRRSRGYRSGKEIADVIEADKLWRKVLNARAPHIDLSRLVCVLTEVGVDPLRVALLASMKSASRK